MVGNTKENGLRKSVSNFPPLIEKIARAMPGFVPVTLTDMVTCVPPDTVLPELGVVKHTVTLYAPEEGVLVAHGLVGAGVGVGVMVGVGAMVGVAVAVAVGFGVGFPFE